MKKQGIYLDTSIFGGPFDEEFKEYTKPLFERMVVDCVIRVKLTTKSDLNEKKELKQPVYHY
jgi:hypothetical protein